MLERHLVPAPGVICAAGAWSSARLDAATSDPDVACELGLVSVDWHWTGKTSRTRLPLPNRCRSRPVPEGAVAAVVLSVAHNAWGMAFWFAATAALLMCGFAPPVSALAGVGWGLGLFLLSVLAHEAGHVFVYRIVGGPGGGGFLVSRGIRCHLVRPTLTGSRDLAVILAGPLTPLATVAVLWPVGFIAPVPVAAWAVLALSHGLTLLAPVGDGANAREAWRARRLMRARHRS